MDFAIKTKFDIGDVVKVKQGNTRRLEFVTDICYDNDVEKVYYSLTDGFAYESKDLTN